jgi:hypothetical protein
MLGCLLAIFTALQSGATDPAVVADRARTERSSVQQRARAIVAREDYQKELVKSDFPMSKMHVRRVRKSGSGGGGGGLARIVMYMGIALALGLVAVWLMRFGLAGRDRRAGASGPADDDDQGASGVRATLAAAERLAATGDFAGAVRVLLHLTVLRLAAERGIDLSAAFTGRELRKMLPATVEEKNTLGLLVETVERSLFGGLSVDGPTYQRCHDALARLG